MLARPKAKTLTAEEQQMITNVSISQSTSTSKPKSWDKNFPVFEVPVNQKLLVYIPNHQIQNPDGSMSLRMDNFLAHPVIDGRSYDNIRCSSDMVAESLGLDGSCPLCEAISDVWALTNLEYKDIARSKGIDPESGDGQEALKEDYKRLCNEQVIKRAERWYTFPIVVIACEEKDGVLTTTPKKNEQGQITGTPMFYQIRERTFLDKWVAGFDALDDEENDGTNNPAGKWAILNFTYQPKSGNPDKMGSAKALKVVFKQMAGYEEWAKYFDDQTKDWDVAKMREVCSLNAIRDMDEMKDAVNSLMQKTRDKLALYSLGGAAASGAAQIGTNADANATLANFGIGTSAGSNPTAEVGNTGVN